jgi:hypothetical protein
MCANKTYFGSLKVLAVGAFVCMGVAFAPAVYAADKKADAPQAAKVQKDKDDPTSKSIGQWTGKWYQKSKKAAAAGYEATKRGSKKTWHSMSDGFSKGKGNEAKADAANKAPVVEASVLKDPAAAPAEGGDANKAAANPAKGAMKCACCAQANGDPAKSACCDQAKGDAAKCACCAKPAKAGGDAAAVKDAPGQDVADPDLPPVPAPSLDDASAPKSAATPS